MRLRWRSWVAAAAVALLMAAAAVPTQAGWSATTTNPTNSLTTNGNFAAGSLYAWGEDTNNELGSNDPHYRSSPTQVAGAWSDYATGEIAVCAIKTTGTLWCWGDNTYGQLGQGDYLDRFAPTQVGVATDWINISGTLDHFCGLRNTDKIYCWGLNGNGQLGINNTTTQPTPTQVTSPAATGWLTVNAGHFNTCATRVSGTNNLYCWGDNTWGQIGDSTLTQRNLPTQVTSPSATGWTAVAQGGRTTCATRTNALYCWGKDNLGQIGNGTTSGSGYTTPVLVTVPSNTNWSPTNFSVNEENACASRTDGTLYCWGNNANGEVGDGTQTQRTSPTQVSSPATTTWTKVGPFGARSQCAIRSTTGLLYCWGLNTSGEVGDATITSPRKTPTATAGGVTTWRSVGGSYGITCADRTDDTLWCWGGFGTAHLGIGYATYQAAPIVPVAGATWVSPSGGTNHACSVKTDGTLWCWGLNTNGQLGINSTTAKTTPTQVTSPSATGWATVAAGGSHTCATRTDGSLYCWGLNTDGQLGDNTLVQKLVPTRESGAASNWSVVTTGSVHTCAMKSTAAIYCWGNGTNGEIGNAASVDVKVPTQESTAATNWTWISAGGSHTCAVKSTGTLWCWGDSTNGQIGDNGTTDRNTPTQASGAATNWETVSGGKSHTCAVKTTGALYCWGLNSSGQLGDNTTTQRLVPTAESGGSTAWSRVASFSDFTCAARTDRSLYCWGLNTYGQLGQSDYATTYLTPTALTGMIGTLGTGPMSSTVFSTHF